MPVRAGANDRSEQVTQLLFGEHYEVLDESPNGKWLNIRIQSDNYAGWIDHRQFHEISTEHFDQINYSNLHISLDPISTIRFQGGHHWICMGSILPFGSEELFAPADTMLFKGQSKPIGERGDWEFLRKIAISYLHAPYQWGGKTPFGIDCSGFTQIVYRVSGYNLLRDASQQVKQGDAVVSLSEYKPGDLAFFVSEAGNITHVGILLEESRIIHASGQVRIDGITNEGIMDVAAGKLTHSLVEIRRIIKT